MGPPSRLSSLPRPLRDLTVAVLFAGAYLLAAVATRELGPTDPALLWLPSGIYLGVLIVSGKRLWPLLACAALAASFGAYMLDGRPPAESLAFAVPSSAEGFLGALILMRLTGDRFSLERVRDVAALLVGTAIVANGLTALSAAAASAQAFGEPFAESWLRWWGADALGILIVAPLVAAAVGPSPRRPARAQLPEIGIVVAGLAAIGYFLSTAEPLGTATVVAGALALPLLLWISWRWSPNGAALAVLIPALVATFVAPRTVDPLGLGSISSSEIIVVQVFLGTLAFASLAFGAAAAERHRADGAAAGSRRRLRRVLETAPDAYVSIDDAGLITDWSPRAETLLGWTRDDALGRRLHETVVPESGREAWLAEVERRATAHGSAEKAPQLTAVHKDGSELPVELTISPATPEEPDAIHLFIHDVTDRERFRDALRETWDLVTQKANELAITDQRATRLADDLTLRTEELDDARDTARRELEAANGERQRLRSELDAAAREQEELRRELASSGSDRERLQAELETAGGEHRQLKARFEAASGEARRLEAELESTGAERERLQAELEAAAGERERLRADLERAERAHAGASAAAEHRLEEVTAAAEHRLEEVTGHLTGERERLERALDAMVMSFAEADRERMLLTRRATELIVRYDRLGVCRYASPACVGLLGFEPAELVGKRGADLMHAEDRQLFHLALTAEGETTFAARMLRADGGSVRTEATFTPVREPDGGRLVSVEASVRRMPDEIDGLPQSRTSEARFDATFGKAPIGMALLGRDGAIRQANAALCRLTGQSRERLEAIGLRRLVTLEERPDLDAALLQLDGGKRTTFRSENGLARADGTVIPVSVSVSVSVVQDGGQRPVELVAQIQDLSQKVETREELRHVTDNDPLTGLYSRRRFEEELRTELAAAGRYDTCGAVLTVNLDGFAAMNDSLGRSRGDDVIRSVAYALRRRLRTTDAAGRSGGDQYAVLLRRADSSQANEAAGALLAAVREVGLTGPDEAAGLTASIGISTFGNERPVRAEELLVESEIAVQDAKHAGGDRTAIHDSAAERPASISEGLGWVDQIRAALEEDRFELYAEPVMSFAGDRLSRHQLLPRMRNADGDLVPAAAFLPAAERFGLGGDIDRWLLRSAIALLAREDHPDSGVRLEVSLSASAPADTDLPAFLAEELRRTGVDPAALCLAIAENAAIHGSDRAGLFLRRLADLGCEVGLDRFGAGLASFLHVEQLPVGYVKLDGALVDRLAAGESARLVVKSIADIAHGLGMRTVAPSVADDQTLWLVRSLGIGYVQGAAVAPARPEAEVELSRPPGLPRYGSPSSSE